MCVTSDGVLTSHFMTRSHRKIGDIAEESHSKIGSEVRLLSVNYIIHLSVYPLSVPFISQDCGETGSNLCMYAFVYLFICLLELKESLNVKSLRTCT